MERIRTFIQSNESLQTSWGYLYALFLACVAQLGWIAAVIAIVAAFYHAKTQRKKSKIADNALRVSELQLRIETLRYDKECKECEEKKDEDT